MNSSIHLFIKEYLSVALYIPGTELQGRLITVGKIAAVFAVTKFIAYYRKVDKQVIGIKSFSVVIK